MEKTTNCWSLYRHTSPSGKVYIGITSRDPKVRWEYGYGYKSCRLFFNAILKYGWNNIKHEILFTDLDELTAKSLEIDLIRHYKNLGISYNITDGGDGALNREWTEEMRAKLRNSRLGKKASEETKKKQSETHKGLLAKEKHPMWGKHHSEETKQKMSKSRSGKKNWRYGTHLTEQEKEVYRKAQKTCISVLQIDLDSGDVIQKFPSIRTAALAVSGKGSHIGECCKGIKKSYKGFKWEYYNGKDNNYIQSSRQD